MAFTATIFGGCHVPPSQRRATCGGIDFDTARLAVPPLASSDSTVAPSFGSNMR